MSEQLGIGILGMGWMGQVHSRAYHAIRDRFPDCVVTPRFVACADEAEHRALDGQRRFGYERTTTDWREVVASDDVHIINIAAPNYLHLEMAEAASAASKHIFCEKPVGCSPSETARIERAARDAGVITWVGYNYRWAPLVQYARQLIRDGALGDVTHYRGRFFVGYGSNPNSVLSWRFQRESAGSGTLGDLMSHVVDMAHAMVGPIERLAANQQTFVTTRPIATPGQGSHFTIDPNAPRGDVTNEDYAGAVVRFAGGAQGTLEACRVINGPVCEMAFELNGTRGAIKWNFERMNELELFLNADSAAQEGPRIIRSGPEHPFYDRFYPGAGNSMSYEDLKLIEAYEFLTSIASGQQREPGLAEARAVAEVLETMDRSWQSQRWEPLVSL
jgi:predicted dehydrogenase